MPASGADPITDDNEWGPPPLHPRIVMNETHAATLTAGLMTLAETARADALIQREANDLYLAAADVECAAMYLMIAEPIMERYAKDPQAFEDFGQATHILTGIQHKIVDDAGRLPLYPETIEALRTHQQAVFNLAHAENIKAILDKKGQGMDRWNEDARVAHICALQFFSYQPPFSEPEPGPDPRPELALKAEAARDKAREIADAITEAYTDGMPINISPKAQEMTGINSEPHETPVTPAFPIFGINYHPGEDEQPTAYIIYLYQETKHVKTLTEPYPKGFPQELAEHYAAAASQGLTATAFENELLEDDEDAFHIEQAVVTMMNAAELGLHDTTQADLRSILQKAKETNIPRGGRASITEAITEYDYELADTVLDDHNGRWRKRATKRQALKVIHTARHQKVDVYTMAELATAMGYEPEELGVTTPPLTNAQSSAILKAVEKAGLPHDTGERILRELM